MGEAVAKCLGLCRAEEAATVPVKVTAGQAAHLMEGKMACRRATNYG